MPSEGSEEGMKAQRCEGSVYYWDSVSTCGTSIPHSYTSNRSEENSQGKSQGKEDL